MADLPDLTTGSIGFIAYWNAIDQGGVADIDAEEALSDGSIQNYTLYDNGWEGNYTSIVGRDIKVRVKNDGWFIARMDRTATYNQNVGSIGGNEIPSYLDILNNWHNYSGPAVMDQHTLERAIQSLQSQLSNAGSITYASTDVGLYNYEFTSATAATGFAADSYANNGSDEDQTCGIIWTSGTTIHYWAVGGSADGVGGNNNGGGNVNFEGTQLCNGGNGNGEDGGSLDVLANNLEGTAGTEQQMTVNTNSSDSWGRSHGTALVIWS